ncbi:MAG TPA: glycosyltransferase family 39 protein [Candidatus Competibacter sp.]|mgnify:CR=1 FL=1|nr:glycosyltransferase family 39 protein [Candidatus Competibacter sp.]
MRFAPFTVAGDGRDDRPLYAGLALALFFSFFYQLGAVPLFDLDEGAFGQATREMFLRGDFMSTYLNGQPRHDKPILSYWLQAASLRAFGVNEFAFRLPSALAASAWTLLVFGFGRRVADSRRGLLAALLLSTSLAVTAIGKAATADALLNLLLAASVMALYLYLREGRRCWLYAAAAAMGLGFLTKGPVAVVIPGGVSLLYCASRGEWRDGLRLALDWRAWLVFFAIAAPWYLLQYWREGEGFVLGFFLRHNWGRFQQPLEGHGGGWWYYAPVLLVGLLPHTGLLPRVALARWRAWIADPLGRYLLIWFGWVLLVFSLAATKLPHYLTYGYTGLFLLMAPEADKPGPAGWLLFPQLLFFGLLLALPGLAGLAAPSVRDELARAQLQGLTVPLDYYAVLAAAVLLTLYGMRERRIAPVYKLIASGLMLVSVTSGQVAPLVASVRQQPVKDAGLLARQYPQQPVVMWGVNVPSFSVYSGRIVERRAPRPGDVALVKSTSLPALEAHEVLYQRHGIALARLAPAAVEAASRAPEQPGGAPVAETVP